MDLFIEHKRIISIVAALMVAVLVIYSYGSFTSYAAAPEVSTLPADIDIDVSYDADTVTFTYNNVTHSIDRNTRYEYINSSSTSNPKFLERTSTGYYIPASYWFSPSENRLYVFSGCTDNSVSSETTLSDFCYILGYVPGSNNATTDIVGNFYLHNDAGGYNSTFMYFIDYNFGYVCNTYKLYSDDGWSRDRNICYWYPNVAKINGEDAYKVLGVSSTKRYYFPADLICVFSNYEISGFYEFDNSKVNTPSYYFNFQYIFYKEKYGYIFVDSAKRVREVGFPNNVNNPRFFFEDICNSYVYSSSDGVSWTLLTTTSTAYAKYFEVSTGTSWTDYTLIYTNDKNFGGDPLVTPDWGDFSDVIEKLPDITDVYDNLLSHKTDKQSTALTGINKFMYNIVSGLTSNIGLGGLYDSIVSSIKGDSYTYSLSEYMLTNLNNDLSVSLVYDYAEIDGEAWEVPRVTLYGYIVHIDKTLNNLLSNFNNLINISDSRLKSIYQNITLSNQYLKRISSNFDSLSIPAVAPDYSGNFDKLLSALDKLHNDLIYEEGVTKLPNVPQYLVYIYGVTKDIRTRLDTVISKLPGSVEIDTDSIVTAVTDMKSSVNDKLDSIIAKIPSTSGGGSFDDSNMVGSIVALKADISDNFNTLIKLLKNDTDDVTDFKDLSDFLTSYIVSMGNAAYFTTLLEFADGVKNNVTLINDTMVTMVSDSGIFAPIFTLGAGFAVFSGLIRKERMN